MTELAAARREIAELRSALADREARDPVAESLLTLGAFRVQLELEHARAERYGSPLTVAVLDLDGFRSLNLERGYAAGDAALAAVGRTIAAATRTNDLGCRSGGDEFTIVFPETDGAGAHHACGRILLALEDLDLGEHRGISASVGVASLESGQSSEAMLAAATDAVQQARDAGGGRVVALAGPATRAARSASGPDAVLALASALEERDRYTSDHSESVVAMTARVAESLALEPDHVDRIRLAALLHDIGKVGIPDNILHKPGPLDEREWEIMRQHPVIGERILRAIPGLGAVARIVRHEHERWDGKGYPDGLAREQVPLGSRVILACDAYHAMTSDRPYRAAMPHTDAVAELTRNAGTQFDPRVVEVLVGYLYGRRQAGLAVA